METLKGKPVAEEIEQRVMRQISSLRRKPHLKILLNPEDDASKGYVRSLSKTGDRIGIRITVEDLPSDPKTCRKRIEELNKDDDTDAVLITRPLPANLKEDEVLPFLDPEKDADALHPLCLGKLFSGEERLVPNTAKAIVRMLEFYQIPLQGKKALVVGRSLSVGKPVAMMLLNRHATVTIAHSKTKNLDAELKGYDIVIGAVGKMHLLKGSCMKEGAVAIDAGIHYTENGIYGDILPDEKLAFLSGVPGGVGPITTACLMENVLLCYLEHHHDFQ